MCIHTASGSSPDIELLKTCKLLFLFEPHQDSNITRAVGEEWGCPRFQHVFETTALASFLYLDLGNALELYDISVILML